MFDNFKKQLSTLIVLSSTLTAINTYALDLDQARKNKIVGETFSGYIAAIASSPSQEVSDLVKSINDKRKQAYTDIANKTNGNTDSVASVAAEKLIKSAQNNGQCYKPNATSSWKMMQNGAVADCIN